MATEVQIDIDLALGQYMRNIRSIEQGAERADDSMDELKKSTKQTSAALNELGSKPIGIKVDRSDLKRARTDVGAIDSTPTVSITVRGAADVRAVKNNVQTIESTDPNVRIRTTGGAGVKDVASDVKKIDTTDPKVSVTTSGESGIAAIKAELAEIKGLAKIDLVMNAAGFIKDVPSLPVISTIVDTENALRRLQSSTGEAFEGGADVINGVWMTGLGESKTQIAEVIARVHQANTAMGSLESASTSAFEAANATGLDVLDVVGAQTRLVQNGLAPSMEAAGDLIVATFQRGGNAGGDLLDTIKEYGSQFAAANISGAESMDLVAQTLALGGFNVDKLADGLKEGTKAAIAFANGADNEAITRLGLADEASALAAGEIDGLAYAEAAQAAIAEKGSSADWELLFGGGAADLGARIWEGLDFTAAANSIVPEGVASEASDNLMDGFSGAFTSFRRTVETGLAESFRIGGKPLTEILDGAKIKIQEITDLLIEGKGLPEALEIALEAPGLAETIRGLEGNLGGFIIDLQLALASVLDILGKGDQAGNLRENAQRQAGTQLVFDLKYREGEDDVAASIESAINRGVQESDITDMIATAAAELRATGDFGRAAELLEDARNLAGQMRIDYMEMSPIPLGLGNRQTSGVIDPSQMTIDEWQAAMTPQMVSGAMGLPAMRTPMNIEPVIDMEQMTLNTEAVVTEMDMTKTVLEPLMDGLWTEAFAAADDIALYDNERANELRKVIFSSMLNTIFGTRAGDIKEGLDTGNIPALISDVFNLGDLVMATRVTGHQPPDASGHQAPINESFLAFSGALGEFNGEAPVFIDRVILPLNNAVAESQAAFENAQQPVADLATEFTDAATDSSTATSGMLTDIEATFPPMYTYLTDLKDYWDDVGQSAYDAWVAQGGQTPFGPAIPPRGSAGGGIAQRGRLTRVGEGGAELITPLTDLAVLNNRSTEAILSGLASMPAGGGGGTVNNVSTVININTSGTAQLMNAAQTFANGLRR